jgi:hypothetical protein
VGKNCVQLDNEGSCHYICSILSIYYWLSLTFFVLLTTAFFHIFFPMAYLLICVNKNIDEQVMYTIWWRNQIKEVTRGLACSSH